MSVSKELFSTVPSANSIIKSPDFEKKNTELVSKFGEKIEAHKNILSEIRKQFLQRFEESVVKAIKYAEEKGYVKARVRLDLSNFTTKDGKSFTYDIALYGFRHRYRGGRLSEWTNRNVKSWTDYGFEIPFVEAQRELKRKGFYLRDETDSSVSTYIFVYVYLTQPPPITKQLWHGHHIIPE